MRPLTLAYAFVGVFAGFTLLLLPQAGHSQGGTGKRVKFETFDEVELVGDFYASSKGKDAAPIMIIPTTNGTRKQPELEALAKALQAAGHAVLLFDLRGQGDSTTVGKKFWEQQINKKNVPGYDGSTIKSARSAGYLPMMVNDIMAAKLFLDRRNDAGDCNSKKLIILGVGDGATLGALWLATEFKRYRVTQFNKLNGLPIAWENSPAGKETLAMISLNITPKIGAGGANPIPWLMTAGRENKVRMAFLYAGQFPGYSGDCHRRLGKTDKYTAVKGVKTGSSTTTTALLKAPETAKLVTTYVDRILEDQGNNDWAMADTEKNGYVWVFKGNAPTIAKMEGEKNINLVPLGSFGYPDVP